MQFPNKAVCMKCQTQYSGKNKENISLVSAEFVQRLLKVDVMRIVKAIDRTIISL